MPLLLALQQLREHPESPFPDWLDGVSRFVFQEVPQWVQQAGVIAGVVVALIAAAIVVWKREPLWRWARTRSQIFYAGAGIAAMALLVTGGLLGWYSWSYMQHDNDFCMSCHVMDVPFEKFTTSEHAELQCHDCHRQPISASARQLYLWVLNRPDEIGEHAPVPTGICAECHIQQQPDSVWQRIVETAGHQLHLESDSLPDIECVTCHGIEVHRFVPVDETCGQSACHDPEVTQVVLGSMAGQTDMHCVGCHAFTAPIGTAGPDSAAQALVPSQEQCFSCHQMRETLVDFSAEAEPHGARCGLCHNPHTQEVVVDAQETCATSECHARADTLTPFHRGIGEAALADCMECHLAHDFKVDGENCMACHAEIVGGTSQRRMRSPTPVPAPPHESPRSEVPDGHPPVAGAAAEPLSIYRLIDHAPPVAPVPRRRLEARAAAPEEVPGGGLREDVAAAMADVARVEFTLASLPADTAPPPPPVERTPAAGLESYVAGRVAQQARAGPFDHRAHRDLQCTDCHTSRDRHGEVTIDTRRDCMSCHHTRPVVNRGCANCHGPGDAPATRRVSVSMALDVWTAPRTRSLPFDHAEHTDVGCATCHTGGIELAAATDTCATCHVRHHTPRADCATCHFPSPRPEHTIDVHTTGCAGSACHEQRTYGELTTGRNTCLTCHQDQVDHRPGQACARCHQVADVAAPVGEGGRR